LRLAGRKDEIGYSDTYKKSEEKDKSISDEQKKFFKISIHCLVLPDLSIDKAWIKNTKKWILQQ